MIPTRGQLPAIVTAQRSIIPTRGSVAVTPPGLVGPGASRRISGQITAAVNEPQWRKRLQLAKYKGVPFYVDQQGRSSGRRVVVFEYPKRDLPYAEDMGRHAIRYQMTGYLVMGPGSDPTYNGMDRDYDVARDRLENALMSPNPGLLQDPYNPRFFAPASQAAGGPAFPGNMPQFALAGYGNQQPTFICERYSIVEVRDKGGYCTVEMVFVEAGMPANIPVAVSAQATVNDTVESTFTTTEQNTNAQQTTAAQSDAPSAPVQVPSTQVPPGTLDIQL
jgi:hypothetical protein